MTTLTKSCVNGRQQIVGHCGNRVKQVSIFQLTGLACCPIDSQFVVVTVAHERCLTNNTKFINLDPILYANLVLIFRLVFENGSLERAPSSAERAQH